MNVANSFLKIKPIYKEQYPKVVKIRPSKLRNRFKPVRSDYASLIKKIKTPMQSKLPPIPQINKKV